MHCMEDHEYIMRNCLIVSMACDAYYKRKGMPCFDFRGVVNHADDDQSDDDPPDFVAMAESKYQADLRKTQRAKEKSRRIQAVTSGETLTRKELSGEVY